MFKKSILAFLIIAMIAMLCGCSDRGTNINEPENGRSPNEAIYEPPGGHQVSDQLALSMWGDPAIKYAVYVPPDYKNPGLGPHYPVLFLLAPFGGTQLYYASHGLVAVADKLIAEGEIEPMIIVCIDGSSGFGGIFYGDSWGGGKYAKAIGDDIRNGDNRTLFNYIKDVYNVDTSSLGWAISGFGVGGYGALRIAVTYSDNFSAVSAVSAPLDFDGENNASAFVPMFKQIISDRLAYLTEINYSIYKPLPVAPIKPGHVQSFTPNDASVLALDTISLLLSANSSQYDTIVAAVYDSFPADTTIIPVGVDTVVLDASATQWFDFIFSPTINLTIGQHYYLVVNALDSVANTNWNYSQRDRYGFGEAWFSGSDYSFEHYTTGDFIFGFGEDISRMSSIQYKTMDSSNHTYLPIFMAAASNFTPYVDYDTIVTKVPPASNDTFYFADTTTMLSPSQGIKFIMPFDTVGNVFDTVWNIWLANNIDSILDIYPSALDSMAIKLFIAGDEGYSFNQQTIDFARYLETYMVGRRSDTNFTPLLIDGYEDYPATIDRFTYDILSKVLKFHSDNFIIP